MVLVPNIRAQFTFDLHLISFILLSILFHIFFNVYAILSLNSINYYTKYEHNWKKVINFILLTNINLHVFLINLFWRVELLYYGRTEVYNTILSFGWSDYDLTVVIMRNLGLGKWYLSIFLSLYICSSYDPVPHKANLVLSAI